MANIFSRLFRSRADPKNSTSGSSYRFFTGRTSSGQLVTERSSMQISAVYACVRLLSESVASLPLHLFHTTGEGAKEKAKEHPLYFLLYAEPNPEMTSFSFRETMMTHLLLWGNSYSQIIRNGRGDVTALYPLMPNRMSVDRDSKTGEIVYTYQVSQDDARTLNQGQVELSKKDVLHIPGLGFDGLIGYSPVAMAKNAIGLAAATEDFGSTLFKNGGRPSGVLQMPGTVKDPEALRRSWTEGFSGSNANRIGILEEGMEYKPISISPEEAQFLETRKFQIEEIARIFHVPPHMIGDLEHATFSNIEQQSLDFVIYSLRPWLIRLEQGFQRSLLKDEEKLDYFFRFNVDGLLRGDYESRMNGFATALQNGFMSPNDIRDLEGLDRISAELGGDNYVLNGNMVKLKDVGAAYEKGEGTSEE